MSRIPERWRETYESSPHGIRTLVERQLMEELGAAEAALDEARKGREHERKVKEQHLERMGEYQDEVTRLQEINHELVNTHNTHVIMGARQNDEIKRLEQQVTQQAATIQKLSYQKIDGDAQIARLKFVYEEDQASLTQQAATIRQLRDALFDARRKATEVIDAIIMYRNKYSDKTYLEGAGRVRNEVSEIIDAALASIPKEPK